MVDATSGAHSPLSKVTQPAPSVCCSSPVEDSLFWTWSSTRSSGDVAWTPQEGYVQLRPIRDAKETDRVIWPGPQQAMSWNQVKRVIRTWRDRKAEMIVFRLTLTFIVPSGQEVKAGELHTAEFGLCRQHDAGFSFWNPSVLLWTSGCCVWVAGLGLHANSFTHTDVTENARFSSWTWKKNNPEKPNFMFPSTCLRAAPWVLRDLFGSETLIWPTSRSAFQMFAVCFGAGGLCVRVCMQIVSDALIPSRWPQFNECLKLIKRWRCFEGI